jgi:hypothetical protein
MTRSVEEMNCNLCKSRTRHGRCQGEPAQRRRKHYSACLYEDVLVDDSRCLTSLSIDDDMDGGSDNGKAGGAAT